MTSFVEKIRQWLPARRNDVGSGGQHITKTPAALSPTASEQGFYDWLLERENPNATLSVPQKLVIEVVCKSLADSDKRCKAVPRLPSVIPRLLQSLRDPETSVRDYAAIVNKDPAVSAAVLRIGNSVFFNHTGKRISNIEVAISKMGIDGLRSVMSSAVMQPLMRCESRWYAGFGFKLWEHSLHCAVACELAARRRNLEPYKAYLLGLLHDVGKLTLFSALNQQFILNRESQPGPGAFIPLMKTMATPLSQWIAEDWQLPPELCTAFAEQIDMQSGQTLSAYGQLLFQANLACEAYATAHRQQLLSVNSSALLAQLEMPADLFLQLDQLHIDV